MEKKKLNRIFSLIEVIVEVKIIAYINIKISLARLNYVLSSWIFLKKLPLTLAIGYE